MTGRKRRKPSEITIKGAKNGGFIVTHRFDNFGAGESYQPPEDNAFQSHEAMLAHVSKTAKAMHEQGHEADATADATKEPTGGMGAKPPVAQARRL